MIAAYPGHVVRLAAYARTLKQRNRLLGEALAGAKRLDRDLLDAWDDQLVNEGTPILWKRWRYVEELKEELKYPLGGNEELEIAYASTAGAGPGSIREIEDKFRLLLKESRGFDERTGHTHRGPHRDNLTLSLNGRSLGDFGSAGQQRSSLISLYFAQMEIHRRLHGRYPVFLMDDVDAELDDRRLQSFLEHITRKTQTFLTTAKERLLPAFGPDLRRYLISRGTIRVS
jgi:DNA replication and repair protein RecF